ncbi:DUF1707 SHOCT-like domain-containing protein [Nocardia brasiliensis]|uniref:DUF1707 SHOCT-like domain-containing protein n=1 Tax=Nocardia brasiliensis TaxID=37326 RepID=UPI002456F332|nr:DUF1707 domain-containing protein [Nocardia brasiliensis]
MVEFPADRITADARERALRELSTHLGAGRLSLVEFDERSSLAAAATTKTELAALFTDLPGRLITSQEIPTRAPVSTRTLIVMIGMTATLGTALVSGNWWWLLSTAGLASAGGLAFMAQHGRPFSR